MRICLLTLDLIGPIRNGGIGTAFTAMAEALAAEGHAVTILYPAAHTETEPLSHWVEHYAAGGINLVCLYAMGDEKRLGLTAHHWLKRRDFDLIHFHEWRGIGHFLGVAKRCGLAYERTSLICQLHSPTAWHREHSSRFMTGLADLEVAHMECRSAELADLVVSPSQYMLDWVMAQGWCLPAHRVQPNLLPRGFAERPMPAAPIEEFVFFGRLEERKGIALFCTALSLLTHPPRRITFLGKLGEVAGESALTYIARAAQGWGVAWDLRNDLDVLGARAFLSRPGRLAVIASASENSPYTVLECLAAGVPFLAPDVGGIAELIHPADRAALLYPREARALAARLSERLGQRPPEARPAFTTAENRAAWMALQQAPAAMPEPTASLPLVSICMASFNRPHLLAEAIASVEAQTYPHVELVVVDDASTTPAARSFLDSLEPRFAARGWQLIRHAENRYLGAARNTAVAAARGEWLLFMDDDNLARPDEVEVFMRAAQASHAAILTCQMQFFVAATQGPAQISEMPNSWIPLGGPLALGFFENAFGDANFFIRREVFLALGGFSTERAAFEDWEFLLRAALAGEAIECLPETLFAYRVSGDAMLRSLSATDAHRAHRRVARAWAESKNHPALEEAMALALDMRVAPRYPAPSGGVAMNSGAALRLAGLEAMAQGATKTARNLLAQALRLEPQDQDTQLALFQLCGDDLADLPEFEPAFAPLVRLALARIGTAPRLEAWLRSQEHPA